MGTGRARTARPRGREVKIFTNTNRIAIASTHRRNFHFRDAVLCHSTRRFVFSTFFPFQVARLMSICVISAILHVPEVTSVNDQNVDEEAIQKNVLREKLLNELKLLESQSPTGEEEDDSALLNQFISAANNNSFEISITLPDSIGSPIDSNSVCKKEEKEDVKIIRKEILSNEEFSEFEFYASTDEAPELFFVEEPVPLPSLSSLSSLLSFFLIFFDFSCSAW